MPPHCATSLIGRAADKHLGDLLRRALVALLRRNITVIGEAARKLDDSFLRAHPGITWSGLVGARNIGMHAYEFVRPELIRQMTENDVAELLAHCLRLLAAE